MTVEVTPWVSGWGRGDPSKFLWVKWNPFIYMYCLKGNLLIIVSETAFDYKKNCHKYITVLTSYQIPTCHVSSSETWLLFDKGCGLYPLYMKYGTLQKSSPNITWNQLLYLRSWFCLTTPGIEKMLFSHINVHLLI